MNKFAQTMYGKIIYIYETMLEKDQLSTIFDPTTYWIDVTGQDVEVGYIVNFIDGVGITFSPPSNEELTLDEEKEKKIEWLNAIRDSKDLEPITTDKGTFDFDENAQKSIDLALKVASIQGIEQTSWTLYDNTEVIVTVEDLNNVILTAGVRKIQNHAHCVELKNQVRECETIDEVRAIEW